MAQERLGVLSQQHQVGLGASQQRFRLSPSNFSFASSMTDQYPTKTVNSETQELEDVVLEDPAKAAPTVHTLGKLEDIATGSEFIKEEAEEELQYSSHLDEDLEKASLDLTVAHEAEPAQVDLHQVSFDNPYHPTRWGPVRRWSILSIYWFVLISSGGSRVFAEADFRS